MTPQHKLAEIIHASVLQAKREKREKEAQSENITTENRNLSQAW
jgi:hypothetical protein